MSQTVKLAEHYALKQPVVFGMPDSWIEDDQVFVKLTAALEEGADVAVGVCRVRPGQRNGGLCAVEAGRVVDVVDKPEVCAYPYIWGALAWRPSFWPLLRSDDPHVGYALPRAIAKGMNVGAVVLDGAYWDCGTPDDYFDCIAAQRVAVPALAG
jgi:dTDP-glucose pyrophosphorylase